MKIKNLVLSTLIAAGGSLLFFSDAAQAAEKSPQKSSELMHRQLKLNGDATRTVFGFEVYHVGLFVTKKYQSEKAIYSDPGKKRIQIKMLRDVKWTKFESTVRKNIKTNFSSAEKKKYDKELERFLDCFVDKTLEKDSVVHIDFIPGKGTRVAVEGRPIDMIEGDEFYHALLRLWIGNPPQKSVKEGLLGKA